MRARLTQAGQETFSALSVTSSRNPGSDHTLRAIGLGGKLTIMFLFAVLGVGCAGHKPPQSQVVVKATCERLITADVVSLDQVYYYNRFGSFNPAGLMYALRRDVVIDREGLDEVISSLRSEIGTVTSGDPDKDPRIQKLKKWRDGLASDRSSDKERSVMRKVKRQDAPEQNGPELLNGDLDAEEEPAIAIPSRKEGLDRYLVGHIKLRSDKRPRPLVLRANEGDCLRVTFTNLLDPMVDEHESMIDPERRLTHPEKPVIALADSDEPATRHASIHVNGLSLVDSIDSQGANVGRNGWKGGIGKCSSNLEDLGKDLCALAAPGETRTYTWYAKKEGTYFFYSMGAPAGGEGDGGQLGLGLFGAVNVQPKGAKWYRSQVTESQLSAATIAKTRYTQPIINYEAPYQSQGAAEPSEAEIARKAPILNMLQCSGENALNDQRTGLCKTGGELIHSDLNAVIDIDRENGCEQMGEGNACGKPYREFTVIFHDEVTAVQAFDDIREENSPLSSLRDGMGINYGASGLGAMVVANKKQIGPGRDCGECKLEEFFLTSWVNGDPAMVVGYEKNEDGGLIQVGQATVKGRNGKLEQRPLYKMKAKYPDDPSNVHHSYLGDPIRFRNMHAGPKETHVFHLHAHQWVEDKHDPTSHYLDSQTISPGTAFSYEVHYGGSGNRNLGPGDSIFHCHLYPHFAQGMWELWRTHDVFEGGGNERRLPDYEITDGTPNPAVVPLPRTAMPPMPTKKFPGYPFYIAGKKGHRPPQPPLDLDGSDDPGTLRRHIITDATVRDKGDAHGPKEMREPSSLSGHDLYEVGRKQSAKIASELWSRNSDPGLIQLARELDTATVKKIPSGGDAHEVVAMKFHAGKDTVHGRQAVEPGASGWSHTPYNWEAPGYPSCLPDGPCDNENGARVLFRVNGGGNVSKDERGQGKPGAPFSNPCPKEWIDENGTVRDVMVRRYRAVYLQMDMTVNKSGWHDPQARFPVLEEDVRETLNGSRPTEPLFFRAQSGECVEFYATNLIPSNLNLDDFQVYSPTDVIGQHIHLVKFDVTSSDGSGNGWNYEDGTLAADEVRERIAAHNKANPGKRLIPRTHPIFLRKGELGATADGALAGDRRGYCQDMGGKDNDSMNHPWCGAQTTIQRWWADPILNGKPGDRKTKDRTMRTVFTHDHFGPSSHQHHGFYAALVIEPRNSKWYFPDGRLMGGTDKDGNPKIVDKRHDGGPTSYAANIVVRTRGKACVTPEKDGSVCSDALDSKGTIDYERTGREFNLAFADFAIVYDKENQPINPPSQIEGGLGMPVVPGRIPMPEGISTKDPGTQLINYRNEPIPLRIASQDKDKRQYFQLPDTDLRSDLANVFSSNVHSKQDQAHGLDTWCDIYEPKKKRSPTEKCLFTENYDQGRHPGDPSTPLLRAYEGDHVQIRLIQGAQEEQHVFTLHGSKWLAQPDSLNTGYVGAQHIGISEHFEFNDRVVEFMPFGEDSKGRAQVDHLYTSNAVDNLWDGQWGLMRVFPRTENAPALARLPGNTEKTHDVLASAFVKQSLDEVLDSERLEVNDEDKATRSQRGFTQNAPSDALEAFCRSEDQQGFVRNFEVEAWLAKDLLPSKKLVYNEHFGIADPEAILFVQASDVAGLRNGTQRPEPLILRARAGDCINVALTNRIKPENYQDGVNVPKTWSFNMVPPITPGLYFNQVRSSHRVGLHPQLVDYNLQKSDGAHVGLNEDSTVKPGDTKTYLWYAGEIISAGEGKKNRIEGIPHEFGAIPLQDMGDVIKHASHGAIGALIVEPQCSQWRDGDAQSKAQADVVYWKPESVAGRHGKYSPKRVCPLDDAWASKATALLSGRLDRKLPSDDSGALYRFKEMVLLYQDNLSLQQYGQPMPNLRHGDDSEDSGQKAFNYRTEPLWARFGASPADEPETMNQFDWSNVLSSTVSHFRCQADFASGKYCDPETPIFTAKAGEQVRLRVVHPGGHPRQHGFTLFGHDWSLSPWIDHSRTMGWNQFSPTRVGSTGGIGPGRAINIMASAGGDCAVHGDYLYRTQEGFMFSGGLWGIFRVEENTSPAYHLFDWQKERWGDHKIDGDSKSGCALQKTKRSIP
ncbi:copper oxidase [Nitrospira sp. BLG_1]|uniref:copper oxidase n=1 Tax=Nitrospira sp. BLG_1 TaxID=3395883 RepID=UPI0039BC2C4A